MVLIQLLLPTTPPNAGATQDAISPLTATRRELAEMFGGLTAYLRSPAKGVWTAPEGHSEQDDVVMVEVITESFDRPWWRAYTARLAERFQQDTIHVRALPIQMLNEQR